MAILAIDFDGVLHDGAPESRAKGYRMGPPMEGAKAAMEELHQLGHELVIYTCRARTTDSIPASTQHVEDWLEYFAIPFDSVTAMKPPADVYLDDKAVRFESWDTALFEILALVALTDA